MSLKLTDSTFLPVANTGDEKVDAYLNELTIAIKDVLDNIFHDLSKGKARHQIFTSAIAAGDLDDGEIALEDVNGTRKIVTYISGTKRSVTIT